MNRYLKIIFFGFLSWLIPFLVSIPLYPQGQPVLDVQVVKSILVVVGGLVGVVLALRYFRNVKGGFAKEGLVLGASWFAINCVLDILVLVLLFGMDFTAWAGQIGIRYLLIPIITTGMGMAMELRGK